MSQTQIVVITPDELKTMLAEAARLGAELSRRQADEQPPGKAWLSPREVRVLAGCGMNKVFTALKDGTLVGEQVPHRQGRSSGAAGADIPDFTWRIARSEAERFAEAVQQERRAR